MNYKKSKRTCLLAMSVLLMIGACTESGTETAAAPETAPWQPVTGAASLTSLFSDTVMSATADDGTVIMAQYHADGTGELRVLDEEFDREWKVKGDDQVCIIEDENTRCYTLEVSTANPGKYRVTDVDSGESGEFDVEE